MHGPSGNQTSDKTDVQTNINTAGDKKLLSLKEQIK